MKHYKKHQHKRSAQDSVTDIDEYVGLTDEDEEYLKKFNQEFGNANFTHGEELLHNTPELRKSVNDESNARRRDVLTACSYSVQSTTGMDESLLSGSFNSEIDKDESLIKTHGYDDAVQIAVDDACTDLYEAAHIDIDLMKDIVIAVIFKVQKLIRLERANNKKQYK